MQAKLIQTVDGQTIVSVFPMENVEPAFSVRDFTLIGYHNNPRQRTELQGAPMFAELVGPMYDGPGMLRYEDSAANDRFSN